MTHELVLQALALTEPANHSARGIGRFLTTT